MAPFERVLNIEVKEDAENLLEAFFPDQDQHELHRKFMGILFREISPEQHPTVSKALESLWNRVDLSLEEKILITFQFGKIQGH